MPARKKIDATTRAAVRLAWTGFHGFGIEAVAGIMGVPVSSVAKVVRPLRGIRGESALFDAVEALWRAESGLPASGWPSAHLAALELIAERWAAFARPYRERAQRLNTDAKEARP